MSARSLTAWLDGARAIPWAMEPRSLETLMAQVGLLAAGSPRRGSQAGRGGLEDELYQRQGRCAFIQVQGPLMRNPPSFLAWLGIPTANTTQLLEAVNAAAEDDEIDTIALSIDSPGGEAHGVHELAAAIMDARSVKTVHAVISGFACSGAYWLAAAADKVTATADSWVGCIGTYMVMVDSSKMAEDAGVKVHVVRSGALKGAGEAGTEITDEQLAATQELVDSMSKLFTKSVAKARGMDEANVTKIATGKTWLASRAKTMGLVDEVAPAGRTLSALAEGDDEMAMPKNKSVKSAAALGKGRPLAAKPASDDEDMDAKAESDDEDEDEDAKGDEDKKPKEKKGKAKAELGGERLRISAMRAAFPDDPAFALEAIEAGSSVVEAQAAYCAVLQAENAELRKAPGKAGTLAAPRAAATPAPSAEPEDHEAAVESEQPKDLNGLVAKAKAHAKASGITFAAAMSELTSGDQREDFRNAVRSTAPKLRPGGAPASGSPRVTFSGKSQ